MRAWLVVELAAMAVIVALAWWLGGTATSAWLVRVGELGVDAPAADAVWALATRARLMFTAAAIALAAARALAVGRAREPLRVPWLLPAMLVACLLGLILHLATVEVRGGVAVAPSGASFALGLLVGSVVGAVVLVVPGDLAQLASRAQPAIALVIAGIFAALAVAGGGPAGTGTKINLGPIQPIELVKPLFVVLLAGWFGARAAKLRWHRRRVLGLRWPRLELLVPAALALIGIFAGLYVIGDLGPVLLLALVFLGMFFLVSRATGWVVIALALVGGLLALLALVPALAGGGTVQTRLVMWRDPWTNGLAHGQQLGEGLWAMAAGGSTGQGLARGVVPVLPAGKTDLALATLTEQLGALGLVTYQIALTAIVLGGIAIAARSRTAERVLLAGGLAMLVLAQWAVIQAGTSGQLPLTGIVVPFVSAGRSSMIAFVMIVALLVRLSHDGRARVASAELDELHAGARGAGVAALVVASALVVTGLVASVLARHDRSARGIVARLADGTLVHRHNPRLLALAAQLRRGTIADRDGAPIAISSVPGARRYPLGGALGTLLGVHPTRVLLPPWALERALDHRLRGYGERADGPRYRDFDPGATDARLPSPDLRALAPLLDLAPAARAARLRALDDALDARSVRLTLDAALQADVARLLGGARGKRLAVAATVIDVDTGDVLARVQVPDYDPGAPAWQDRVIAHDTAFLRQFRGTYGAWPDKTGLHGMFQAGSVGKLFSAVAAVRAGLADARYACVEQDAQGPWFTRPGWGKAIHDHAKDRPHGTLGLAEALAVSCNVYFGQLGLDLGPEPLVALRRAGADVGYGVERFTPGEAGSRQLASTAFGQGAMVMSTTQAARLVAAIAGGGRYLRCAPTMELGAPCVEHALVDDPALLASVIAGMRQVVTTGTAARLAEPAGVRVYAKTGTADVRGFVGEEPFGIRPGQPAAPHAWFVAFGESAAVAEHSVSAPGRIAVAVVVPRGGTGAAAAGPIAMQILAAAKQRGYLQ